jgi:hypothetical protein
MKEHQTPRRRFLKIGAASLAMIPVMVVSDWADAETNAAMRAALKYQNKPEGEKSCSNCVHFIPGASASKLGGCAIMPGDNEISPHGYCIGWVKKA